MSKFRFYLSLLLFFSLSAANAQDEPEDSLVADLEEYIEEPAIPDSLTAQQIYYRSNFSTNESLDTTNWKKLSASLDYSEEPKEEKKERAITPSSFPASGFNFKLNPTVARVIVYGLIIGFVIMILIKLGFLDLFRGLASREKQEEFSLEPEEKEERRSSFVFYEKAKNQQDLREALRLYYLSVLYLLFENGMVQVKKEKTNSAYLRELKNTEKKKDFAAIIRTYENVWFGDKQINKPDFEAFTSKVEKIRMELNG